jgi:hypothetical protein
MYAILLECGPKVLENGNSSESKQNKKKELFFDAIQYFIKCLSSSNVYRAIKCLLPSYIYCQLKMKSISQYAWIKTTLKCEAVEKFLNVKMHFSTFSRTQTHQSPHRHRLRNCRGFMCFFTGPAPYEPW